MRTKLLKRIRDRVKIKRHGHTYRVYVRKGSWYHVLTTKDYKKAVQRYHHEMLMVMKMYEEHSFFKYLHKHPNKRVRS